MLAAADEAENVVNSADEEGWAPLHSAASIGNSEIVDILLSRGWKIFEFPCFYVVLSCSLRCYR